MLHRQTINNLPVPTLHKSDGEPMSEITTKICAGCGCEFKASDDRINYCQDCHRSTIYDDEEDDADDKDD